MKLKLRPKIVMRNAVQGDSTSIHAVYAIEVCRNRRWTLLGDEGGPFYFETPTERNSKMHSLSELEVAS
jgi:hypothetical protein